MGKAEIVIRDARRKDKYTVDDEYLNGYAKVCGIYATGVYNVLCRHADFHTQQSFPSIETIAEKLGIGKRTVSRALAVLEGYNVIAKERVRHPQTSRWKHNSYTLVDKTKWKPHASQAHGSTCLSGHEPHACECKSHMPVGTLRLHIRRLHIKRIFLTKNHL